MILDVLITMGIYGGYGGWRIVCQVSPWQAFLKFSETYPREDVRELFAGTAR